MGRRATHSYRDGDRSKPAKRSRRDPELSRRYDARHQFLGRARFRRTEATPDRPAVREDRSVYRIDATAIKQVYEDSRK